MLTDTEYTLRLNKLIKLIIDNPNTTINIRYLGDPSYDSKFMNDVITTLNLMGLHFATTSHGVRYIDLSVMTNSIVPTLWEENPNVY